MEAQVELKSILSEIAETNLSDIDKEDNLFYLGLDSLMIVQFRSKIQEKYAIDIPMKTFLTRLTSLDKIEEFLEKTTTTVSINSQKAPTSSKQKMTRSIVKKPSSSPSSSAKKMNFRNIQEEEDRMSAEQQKFVAAFIERYTSKTRKSKEYAKTYRSVLADWITSLNFRPTLKEVLYPVVVKDSKGSNFWDIDGNEYIDCSIGYGTHFFGHKPDFLIEALDKQIKEHGYVLCPQDHNAGSVAKLITELTGVERVSFCNTGSEAVLFALRIARTVTGRKKIIRLSGSYHGTSDIVLAERDEHGSFPTSPGVMAGAVEDLVVLQFGLPDTINTIRELGDEVAGLLVEPVQSRKPGYQNGDYLKQLRQVATEIGAALIFDEVFIGFRCHVGGAQAHFGIEADIVTYGKSLAGGLPIGIVSGKAKYMSAVDGGTWQYGDDSKPDKETTFFGGTYCKHPLAMAAARACLLQYKEKGQKLIEEATKKVSFLSNSMNTFFKDQNVPFTINHFGPLFLMETWGKYSSIFSPIEIELFYNILLDKGIYIWEKRIGNLSTAHTDDDVEQIIKAMKSTIFELRNGGFSLG